MARLVDKVGGDPWVINQTLQRGRPAQISYLAQAFLDAGTATREAQAAFEEARRHFEAAWNREHGEHPINDAAEVRRATESLGLQAAQLPKIAVDLERVAAVLAETQRAAGGQIAALERQLEDIDRRLGDAYGLEGSGHLSRAEQTAIDRLIHELEQQAIDDARAALRAVYNTRNMYSDVLQRFTKTLRTEDGYDAATVGTLDAHEFETPDQAQIDVHAALAGDQQAAIRVNNILNSITDEQQAGKVPLTPEQAAVLSQLQAQQHGMSIEALGTAMGRLGDQGEMIANSWQLMSNPALTFPRTELTPGAKQGAELVRGGGAQLPESLHEWETTIQRGDIYLLRLSQAAGIAAAGNPRFRSGTDLDRMMLRQAEILLDDPHWRDDLAERDTTRGPVVATVLTLVSPDHQVVHDLVAGLTGQRFLSNVTHNFWSDDGRGAASLFDWVEGAAHGPQAGLAAETARAYGLYLGTHSPELLHLPGGHTFGEVNPELARSMAHGLAPYIGNIAGVPGGLPEFGTFLDKLGAIESGEMPIAKGIFSVLSTDRLASDYFNGIAEHHALLAESAYASDLTAHAPNMNSYNAHLGTATTLRGLVDTGIHNAVRAEAANHQITADAAQLYEYNQRRSAYEAGVKIALAAAGGLPQVGAIAGPAVSILGGLVENDILGPAPISTATDYGMPQMSIGRADREILNNLIAAGQHIPIPEPYLVDGRIGAPDEVARAINGLTPDVYDHVLSQALTDLFRQNFGNDPVPPVIPDQHMMNRYNAIIANPVPGPPR